MSANCNTIKNVYTYKKGDRPSLDEVYSILGVIPNDVYHQDDINESNIFDPENKNDSGESILFLKDITINIVLCVFD